MRDSLKSNQAEVLMMKTNTNKQVNKLTTTFPPDMLKPNRKANMIFSVLADITAACHSFGHVSTSSSPNPSKSYIIGKGLDVAKVGETSTAVLQAIDFNGQPCEEPVVSSEIELVSELTGTRTRGSIERTGQSQYKISYQPTIKGRHQLHIKVEGQHIRGSPFIITAKSPVENLGSPVITVGNTRQPCAVALNQVGDVVITECEAHCVSVFGPSGEKLRSFGEWGSDNGQFRCPHGVAVDREMNILVADHNNHRIQKFSAEGQFLQSVGTKGNGPLQFAQPEGIAFNIINKKVYVTDYNHRVQVLNSDLTYSSTFGKYGSGKGQFNTPCGIACDATGKVYVADSLNYRIQVFTEEGKFLRMFGKYGDGRGEMNRLTGIAVDSDMVYIGDFGNCRVSVFTSEGISVTSFGYLGEQPGKKYFWPCGIAVDSCGAVYVCDKADNVRYQVF